MIIGYTSGVFDLFHIGHLNLLRNAKGMCDKLIVGVTTDELVSYKGKFPVIPFVDRLEIVRNIKYVDAVVAQSDMDKLTMCKKLKANVMFVGDDWYLNDKWEAYEKEFAKFGIDIVYFPRTQGISSTQIGIALQTLHNINELSSLSVCSSRLIKVDSIVLSVGQACNLKCKECGALTPYAPQEIRKYKLENIIQDLKLFIKNGFEFEHIQIQGGEPLLYKDLPELLKWLNSSGKFNNIVVATNGTIIPNNALLDILKLYNIQMRISDYDTTKNKETIPALINILNQKCIRNYVYQFMSGKSLWYQKGGLEMKRENDDKIASRRFSMCKNNICLTIENSKLCYCTRALNAPLIQGFEAKNNDILNISDRPALRVEILNYLNGKHYMEACRYCYGTDENRLISPAEQMP